MLGPAAGTIASGLVGEGAAAIHVAVSPASTRLFLIRHGEVDPQWQGRVYGSLDVPLSERGRRDASRIANLLSGADLAAVVSSGLSRTEHMAAGLRSTRRLEREDDPALRELERGEWAGLSLAELEAASPGAWTAWFRNPATERPPGGESLNDLFERVKPRIDHWSRAHSGRSVALVTHGWVVRVLVCHVLGAGFELAPRLDVRTGDVTLLRWALEDGEYALEAFCLDRLRPQLSE